MDYLTARGELLARPGRPTAARRRALVGLTDDWLTELFVASGADPQTCALVTVGGYGRGQLSPGSDLDLVLLHESGAEVGQIADRIWYPIWDAGMRLDHSVRTVAEARRLAGQDLKVVLGILDVRAIAGSAELATKLRGSVLQDWRAMASRRLPELHEYVLARASRAGELAYLLEPDLKESFGGLRDATILRAIAASWVCDADVDGVAADVENLLDVRDGLHLVTGRHSDRLMLQEHAPVAQLLGLGQPDELLRAVSTAGRSIGYASDEAWFHVTRATTKKRGLSAVRRLRPGRPDRSPLADGVVVQDGEAVLAVDARPDRDPVLVLRAAAAAAQAGLRLSPHAVRRLANESAPMPEPWPVAARDSLVSLLGAGRSAIPVWESLDQAGLICALLPEWEHVRSAPQHNPVHRFTVDRHLVETAANAATLTRQVSRPDLLLMGALLHDIGKGLPGDHSEVGVDIVRSLAPRIGFNEDDSDMLTDLVRYHLLLPETATRRDLSDPATAEMVAKLVRTPLMLDLLVNLTRADAAATGPAAWSEWKSSLINALVGRTRAILAGEEPAPLPILTPEQEALAEVSGVAVQMAQADGATQVTVAADDRVGLLALVSGVLAVNRLAVRSARTRTVEGRAVTVWTVMPEFGDPPALELLRDDVRRAFAGSLPVEAKIAAREEAYSRSGRHSVPDPTFRSVPQASQRASVVEIRAHDRPGLLYTIATAISSTLVSIDAAQVSTLGSEVVDVFYLSDRGLPLTEDQLEMVRTVVLGKLSRPER